MHAAMQALYKVQLEAVVKRMSPFERGDLTGSSYLRNFLWTVYFFPTASLIEKRDFKWNKDIA